MSSIGHSPESHAGFPCPLPLAALAEHLSDEEIEQICRDLGHTWRDRQFPPGVTVRSCVHRALNGALMAQTIYHRLLRASWLDRLHWKMAGAVLTRDKGANP